MRLVRTLLVCALVLAVPTGTLLAGQGRKAHRKDHPRAVRGVVVEVRKDQDKDNGSLTLRVRDRDPARKDRDDRRTFQIMPLTRFVKVHEGKHTPASFADVHDGQRVRVYPLDDRPAFARVVAILHDAR